jgi:hypothetical protein
MKFLIVSWNLPLINIYTFNMEFLMCVSSNPAHGKVYNIK